MRYSLRFRLMQMAAAFGISAKDVSISPVRDKGPLRLSFENKQHQLVVCTPKTITTYTDGSMKRIVGRVNINLWSH